MSAVGQALDVQREDVDTKAIANAAKAFEGKLERFVACPEREDEASLPRALAFSTPQESRQRSPRCVGPAPSTESPNCDPEGMRIDYRNLYAEDISKGKP